MYHPANEISVGSSYANQLYPGFVHNHLLKHHVVLSIGACDIASKATFDLNRKHPCSGQNIMDQIRFIDDIVAKDRSIRFVVIGGLYGPFDEEYISLLKKRIDYYEGFGAQVIIFTTHMTPGYHPKACLSTPLKKLARDCTFPLRERQARFDEFKPVIDALSKSNPKVRFFEQNGMYCRNGECSFVLNGMPLHRDEAHLSEFGSIELRKHFTEWARQNVPQLFDIKIDLRRRRVNGSAVGAAGGRSIGSVRIAPASLPCWSCAEEVMVQTPGARAQSRKARNRYI